ncbi:protein VAPYRIN-LIKE [Ricinus communis]|uniref:Ankyrin repeat-containing protein, putative n=1 Tax=Ricinus communis TaxID=3988 RepID=B9S3Z4_RICCO|nr:protein VAPYRIN-LIKE [Ricinus communis]EEF41675.1 ankyrin repeat-containing protein, putative [Ricinus communis]|eukprot:XP_002520713.1 ankyrin-1 [Ricinus communis]
MDRLVKADVKEIEISFKKGQKCTATFRLSNLMHTMSVAVSLATTSPSFFTFNQSFSIIPPLSTSSYTLILSQPSDQSPPFRTPPHVITVISAMLPTGKAHVDDLRRLFSRPGPHIFKDAAIPISLVGPHIADYIIARHAQFQSSNLCSYFNRAISGCTGSQLTTLLESAVMSGNADLVAKLVDLGGDLNRKDLKGHCLIILAVRAGNLDVVKVLISSGCLIDNLVDKVLHEAAAANRVDIMEVLCCTFKDLVDSNSTDLYGRTPIHVAATLGHVEAIKFCASIGVKVEAVDCDGCTPLHLAAEKGHLEAVECLLDCSCYLKYVVNKEGKTAFGVAIDNGNSDLFGLLRLGDVLHRAAGLDDVNGIKNCISEGVNVNDRDQNGWTPLHRAAFKGRIESVRTLLSYGAIVDPVDDDEYTPLHCAVETGHIQVAMLLMAHGAKANVKKCLKTDMTCSRNWSALLGKKCLCEEEDDRELCVKFSSCVL